MLNPNRAQRQLEPVLGQARATTVTSIANGLFGTIQQNPLAASLLAPDVFPALAALYGSMRQIAVEGAASDNEKTRERAARTLEEIDTIVAATNAADPNPQEDLPDFLRDVLGKQVDLSDVMAGVGAAAAGVREDLDDEDDN